MDSQRASGKNGRAIGGAPGIYHEHARTGNGGAADHAAGIHALASAVPHRCGESKAAVAGIDPLHTAVEEGVEIVTRIAVVGAHMLHAVGEDHDIRRDASGQQYSASGGNNRTRHESAAEHVLNAAGGNDVIHTGPPGNRRLIADKSHPAGESLRADIKFAAGGDDGISERSAAGNVNSAAGVDGGGACRSAAGNVHGIVVQGNPGADLTAGNIVRHVYRSLSCFLSQRSVSRSKTSIMPHNIACPVSFCKRLRRFFRKKQLCVRGDFPCGNGAI